MLEVTGNKRKEANRRKIGTKYRLYVPITKPDGEPLHDSCIVGLDHVTAPLPLATNTKELGLDGFIASENGQLRQNGPHSDKLRLAVPLGHAALLVLLQRMKKEGQFVPAVQSYASNIKRQARPPPGISFRIQLADTLPSSLLV